MTPKEKAKDLLDKFLFIDMNLKSAKQCALIAVGEVLRAICKHDSTAVWDYWQQVKAEIENL